MSETLHTIEAAAKLLTISKSGCYDLMKKRLIRFIPVSPGGKGYRIPQSAIEEYLAGRTVGVGETPDDLKFIDLG